MNTLLVLPIVVPFFTAILCILAWQNRQIQRFLAILGTTLLLMVGMFLVNIVQQEGIQVTYIGEWQAPFGITLVADLFSSIMVVMAGLVGLMVVIFSLASVDERRRSFGYYPLVLFLLMGVSGAFLTGDMFNLYVWFEVMLITSFVLLVLGGERAQMEGAIKYFALNLLVSALFLTGVGSLYSVAGSLNMADLATILPGVEPRGLVTVIGMFFLVSFGIKAAIFPFFFWLPAAYHTPPVAVTTLFSGLMTKVGVYALIRVFSLVFTQDSDLIHGLFLLAAGLTMLTGVIGAVAQYDFRRLLSFHIISQIGYLLMGLGLFTTASLTGTIFFMVHVIISKSALFLVSGVSYILCGTYDLKKLGGLYRGNATLALLFMLPALALAGIPPFSGFWAKLALIRASLDVEHYLITAVALFVSVLTLFSMMKIWTEAFWKDSPLLDEGEIREARRTISNQRYVTLLIPVIILAGLTLVIGFGAELLLNLSSQAAQQLTNPSLYIAAVLGETQ